MDTALSPALAATLPPATLEVFKREIEGTLRASGVDLSGCKWTHIDRRVIQTLAFSYMGRPLHLYVSLRPTELGFGISYLTDYGVRETVVAPPAAAGPAAAAAIQRTFARAFTLRNGSTPF